MYNAIDENHNVSADRPAPATPAAPEGAEADAARAFVLNRPVRETLRQHCERGYHSTISWLTFQPARDRLTVLCASRSDRSIMADVLIGALRAALADAGLVELEPEIVAQGEPRLRAASHGGHALPRGGLRPACPSGAACSAGGPHCLGCAPSPDAGGDRDDQIWTWSTTSEMPTGPPSMMMKSMWFVPAFRMPGWITS